MKILDRWFPPNVARLKEKRDLAGLILALKHPDAPVRQAAAAGLGDLKECSVAEPLVGALGDSDLSVRIAAAIALAGLPDPRGVDFLLRNLRYHPAQRQAAENALQKLFTSDELTRLVREHEIRFRIMELQNNDARVRAEAEEALIKLTDPAAAEPLIEFLDLTGFRSGCAEAARVLGQLGDNRAVAPLIAVLGSEEHWRAHEAVVQALAHIRDDRALQPLVRALQTSDSHHVRYQAATALGKLGNRSAVDALLLALADPVDDVRMRAALALAELGDSRAVEGLTRARMRPDEQRNVRETIDSALRALGAEASSHSLEPLLAALRDPHRDTRSAAAEALLEMGAIETLLSCLRDQDPKVRASAAGALRAGDARAVPPLISALADESADVRSAAVASLAQVAGIRVIAEVANSLKDESADVRSAAAYALGNIGSPAEEILITALGDESESVRQWVEGSLKSLRDRRKTTQELVQSDFSRPRLYLADENWMTRGQAVDQLADLVAPEVLNLLGDVLKSDTNARVRKSAVDGIGRLAIQRAIPEAEDLLIHALQDPDRASVSDTAAVFLGRIGGEKAGKALRQYRSR